MSNKINIIIKHCGLANFNSSYRFSIYRKPTKFYKFSNPKKLNEINKPNSYNANNIYKYNKYHNLCDSIRFYKPDSTLNWGDEGRLSSLSSMNKPFNWVATPNQSIRDNCFNQSLKVSWYDKCNLSKLLKYLSWGYWYNRTNCGNHPSIDNHPTPNYYNTPAKFGKLDNFYNYSNLTKKNKQNKKNKQTNQTETPKSNKPNKWEPYIPLIIIFIAFLVVNLNWLASNYYGISITRHVVDALSYAWYKDDRWTKFVYRDGIIVAELNIYFKCMNTIILCFFAALVLKFFDDMSED